MKITIYELLGMIKDGKAPKRIIYRDIPMIYDNGTEDYIPHQTDKFHGNDLFHYLFEEETKIFLNGIVEILEEQKKIPEKLPYYSMEKIQKAKNKDEWHEERISLLEKRVNDLHIKMNDLLDYLKSKGE